MITLLQRCLCRTTRVPLEADLLVISFRLPSQREDTRRRGDVTSRSAPRTGLQIDGRARLAGTTIPRAPAPAAGRRLPDAGLHERGRRRRPGGLGQARTLER